LADRWTGLTPGFHRFAFDDACVLLTLCVGDLQQMLREQAFRADAICLAELPLPTLKMLPRLCRRGTLLAAPAPDAQARKDLASCGFEMDSSPGAPLQARYAPRWEVKGLPGADAVQP